VSYFRKNAAAANHAIAGEVIYLRNRHVAIRETSARSGLCIDQKL
jgi:hypothetical protein